MKKNDEKIELISNNDTEINLSHTPLDVYKWPLSKLAYRHNIIYNK